jgi:coatomer subunit beta'
LQILIDTNRLPEAALFARTYLPSKIAYVVDLWKNNLSKTNEKASKAIADPNEYENLFPDYIESLRVEKYLAQSSKKIRAGEYINVIVSFVAF